MTTDYKGFTITESNESVTFNGVTYVERFTIRTPEGELIDNQDEKTVEECQDTIDEIIKSEPEPLSIEDLEYNALEERGQKERNGEWAYDLR